MDGIGIVSHHEWLAARRTLLRKEKSFTRQREALTAERMQLPWVRFGNEYAFDGPDGSVTLAELFDGRSQLIIYHFMIGPGWKEGCVGFSLLCDGIEGGLPQPQRLGTPSRPLRRRWQRRHNRPLRARRRNATNCLPSGAIPLPP